jgi:predicted nucleic acid-binding protein
MKLVVDTNVVMSALIKNSVSRSLIFNPKLELFLPDFSLKEIEKYSPEILKKSGMKKAEFDLLLQLILSNFLVARRKKYENHLKKAEKICPDKNDIVFLALALSLKIPLWTNDKSLKNQSLVKVYSTEELMMVI